MKKRIILLILAAMAAGCAYADELSDVTGMSLTASLPPAAQALIGGFSVWGMVWGTLFGAVGVFAFLYGKKKANAPFIFIGVLLCIYPFVVRDAMITFIVGALLSGSLYFFRR
jgi:hypothetical protein